MAATPTIECDACKGACSSGVQHVLNGRPRIQGLCFRYFPRIQHGATFKWSALLNEDRTWCTPKILMQGDHQKTFECNTGARVIAFANECLGDNYAWSIKARRVRSCTGAAYMNLTIAVHNAYLYSYWKRVVSLVVDASPSFGGYTPIYSGMVNPLHDVFVFKSAKQSYTIKNIALPSDVLGKDGRISFRIAIVAFDLHQELK